MIKVGFALLLALGVVAEDASDRVAVEKDERIIRRRGLDTGGNALFGGGDPLGRIRDLMNRMFQGGLDRNFFGLDDDNFFSNSLSGGIGGVEVQESEDESFKYMTLQIQGLDQDTPIKIKVEDGVVHVSGGIKQTQEFRGLGLGRGQGTSVVLSSFKHSFSVPPEVDEGRVQFETSEDSVTVKFPKI